MNKIIYITIILFTCFTEFKAQDLLVYETSVGLLIIPDSTYQSISKLTVERRKGTDEYIVISAIQKPEDFDAFQKAYNKYQNEYPQLRKISKNRLSRLWSQHMEGEDLLSLHIHPAIYLALGKAFLDKSATMDDQPGYRINQHDFVKDEVKFLKKSQPGDRISFYPYSSGSVGTNIQNTWFTVDSVDFGNAFSLRKRMGVKELEKIPSIVTGYYNKDTLFLQAIDTTLRNLGSYQYSLEVFDWLGNDLGPTPSIFGDNLNALSAPSVINTHAEGLSDQRAVKLNWQVKNVERVRELIIFRSTKPYKGYTQVAVLNPSDTTFIDYLPYAMEAFYYFVAVRDIHGELIPGVQVYGISKYQETPLRPLNIFASSINGGIQVTWRRNDPYTRGFEIYRGLSGTELTLIDNYYPAAPEDDQVYLDTSDLLLGSEYYSYAIKTINDGHLVSEFSDTTAATPGITAVSKAPAIQNSQVSESGEIRLSWNNLTEELPTLNNYELYKKGNIDTAFVLRATLPHNENVFLDQLKEEAVEYKVRGLDHSGQPGPFSTTEKVIFPTEYLITFLQAKKEAGNVRLQWVLSHDVPFIDSYRIFRAMDDQEEKLLIELEGKTFYYIDQDLSSHHSYSYYIIGILPSGREIAASEPLLIRW